MSKFLIPTGVIEPKGKITTTLRMQEPTTRKRGQGWNPEMDKVNSPESD
jgi:hypothetical protein